MRAELTFTKSTAGGTAVHSLEDIAAGEDVFRIPTSSLLWRGASLGAPAFQADQLSAGEHLVLALAAIKKGVLRPHESSPIRQYGVLLREEPPPNATVLWKPELLAFLRGTEAAELTEHFLRRISHIHAAAPLLLEYEDIQASWNSQMPPKLVNLDVGSIGSTIRGLKLRSGLCYRFSGWSKALCGNFQ